MTSTNFKPTTQQKSSRLYTMVGFLVMLLAFVAATFFLITKESRNEQEWISLSTDLQVHSQQLAKSASEAVEGDSDAFLKLAHSRGVISGAMAALKNGEKTRSLPALPGAFSETLSRLDRAWVRMETNAGSILEREKLVLDLAAASRSFIGVIPRIQELTDEAVRRPTRYSSPAGNWCWPTGFCGIWMKCFAAEPVPSAQPTSSFRKSANLKRPWTR
jgi:twitching motility protein PilJ